MKKLYTIAALLIALGCAPSARAESTEQPQPSHVMIAAIQTGQTTAAGNDYVLLHNDGGVAIDVTDWKLQYRAASVTGASGWTTKRTIACEDPLPDCRVLIGVHGNLFMSTYTIPDMPTQRLSSGFSGSGGQLRLAAPTADNTDLVPVDMVGYGTAATYEGETAAPAPSGGEVIVRRIDNKGGLLDTNSNGTDFATGCVALATIGVPILTQCPQSPANEDEQSQTVPPVSQTDDSAPPADYPPVFITELLPDPVSPAIDSHDEFIELFNPSAQPIEITGYTLETGADFKYHYVLDEVIIAPGGYYAVYSSESHLSLTNTGTAVRILSPTGDVSDMVVSYGQAKTGQAWIKAGNNWEWSTQPSPATQNIISPEPVKAVAAATAAKKATTAVTKKATSSTAKAVAAAKTPTVKAPKAVAATTPPTTNHDAGSNNMVNYIILGAAALGILGYIGYEYRQDIARAWGRLRNKVLRRKEKEPEATLQTD